MHRQSHKRTASRAGRRPRFPTRRAGPVSLCPRARNRGEHRRTRNYARSRVTSSPQSNATYERPTSVLRASGPILRRTSGHWCSSQDRVGPDRGKASISSKHGAYTYTTDALSDSGVAHRSAGGPRELLGAENPERAVVDADAAQASTEQTS